MKTVNLHSILALTLAFTCLGVTVWCKPPPAHVDDDHDGLDDALEQLLAETYAPVIFIEPDESNYPVNVEWFLARAHLQYHEDCWCWLINCDHDDDMGPNPLVTQWNLLYRSDGSPWANGPYCGEDDTGYSHPPHRLLTTVARDPDGQWSVGPLTTGYSDQQTFVLPDLDDKYKVGSTNPGDWVTYYHCYPTVKNGVMIQYWHLFAYNGLGFQLGSFSEGYHGGDWDATIHVQLDTNLNLKGVWFSRHQNDHPGDWFAVTSADLHTYHGTHPLMAIDGGGHAAFADPNDFFHKHAPIVATRIAWPADPTDPIHAEKLLGCWGQDLGCYCSELSIGGIIWETWTDGSVLASGELTHPISTPSRHGGLVNLGEYNPCMPAPGFCMGSAQASPLLAGALFPLNRQIFIAYEGKWGSLPSGINPGQPPRGPVFQGWQDNGEGKLGVYTAWYNQGADVPVDASQCPWGAAPTSTLSCNGLFPGSNGVGYVSKASSVSLAASQNSVAARFGSPRSCYRVYVPGASKPGFTLYMGPFSVAGADGPRVIEYYALDALNNQGITNSRSVTLDRSAPTITILKPTPGTYMHSETLTLNYSVSDGNGSGVQSVAPTLDGNTGGPWEGGVESGQSIYLGVLCLGQHTFSVTARDNMGNAVTNAVTFSITGTSNSNGGRLRGLACDPRDEHGGPPVPRSFHFTFSDGTVGEYYRIQRCLSLTSSNWIAFKGFLYTEPTNFSDSADLAPMKFYRAVTP